jgi:hypothetical protein
MRTLFFCLAFATAGLATASAQSPPPSPLPAGPSPTVASSSPPTQCQRPTRCLTAEMLPIGTPINVLIDAWISPKLNEHAAAGQASILTAEDVVLNGRLIVVKGRPGTFTFLTVLAAPYCESMTVSAVWVHTQDYQVLPVSFADPRKSAANSFTFPMGFTGPVCRRNNVPATVYISGPPTLDLPPR